MVGDLSEYGSRCALQPTRRQIERIHDIKYVGGYPESVLAPHSGKNVVVLVSAIQVIESALVLETAVQSKPAGGIAQPSTGSERAYPNLLLPSQLVLLCQTRFFPFCVVV